MFRYIALTWDVDNANQCVAARLLTDRLQARARSWSRVEQENGLCILHKKFRQGSLDIHSLPGERGVLIGALFERRRDCTDEAAAHRFVPNLQQSDQIVASRGSWLIEHTWGNYVALIRDPASRRIWAVKDPSGNLPCLLTELDGVQIVFGNIADLVATGLFRFTINQRYLRNRLLHGGALDQDALNEVQTIQRGECVELGGPKHQRIFHWHPLAFANPCNAIEDPVFAAQAIRATVRSCTRTLCGDHQSILHRLSGGLDSSIIAACLADVPVRPRLNCYTYYTPGGRSDERPWARLAAGRHGFTHKEYPADANQIPLPQILHIPPQGEPTASLGYLLRSTLEQNIACEHRATAVFCGDGGDSGFCGDTFAYAMSEYLQRHGLRLQAFRLAAGIAAVKQESTWTVIAKSLRRWRRGAGMEHQRKTMLSVSTLLDEELRASYSDALTFPHPWFNHLRSVPWSLVRRLGSLLVAPEFYNVAPGLDAPEVVAPLYSQPATELFLSIPLDVHFHGARERGLAREAFAPDVPAEILHRTWKDRVPGFVDSLVSKHRAFLREMLLDGELVEARLLNRNAVEAALSGRMSRSTVYPGELLRHLDVEVWLRTWHSRAALDTRSRMSA